jgi:hypothetical protein
MFLNKDQRFFIAEICGDMAKILIGGLLLNQVIMPVTNPFLRVLFIIWLLFLSLVFMMLGIYYKRQIVRRIHD